MLLHVKNFDRKHCTAEDAYALRVPVTNSRLRLFFHGIFLTAPELIFYLEANLFTVGQRIAAWR